MRLVVRSQRMDKVQPAILVDDMTDPNWGAGDEARRAIVTNRGSRTCHAAIIARELGISGRGGLRQRHRIQDGRELVTVACAEATPAHIYDGLLETEITEVHSGECRCPIKIA